MTSTAVQFELERVAPPEEGRVVDYDQLPERVQRRVPQLIDGSEPVDRHLARALEGLDVIKYTEYYGLRRV